MRRATIATPIVLLCLLVPLGGVALADFGDFPGNPSESPRLNTPNDPEFDRCEEDDEDEPDEGCESYFNEQYGSFGFNPDSARDVEPLPGISRTDYEDCSQLDQQGQDANVAAGDPACSQIAGVRADTAWKYSIGSPDTTIAILDTGIEWESRELIEKVDLNEDELPTPETTRGTPLAPFDGGQPCGEYGGGGYDKNGDGAVNVRDYACDPRVEIEEGDSESDGVLDASDLIARFSDDVDDDPDGGNGYVDDIAGWDFFDDDNDPFDASSCCSAGGHGTGRAGEAARQTDDGRGKTGMCPECQVMPIRVWDTFVVDSNLFSLGVVYAADNGAEVVEGAVGGLLNSRFARRAFTYADEKGVALTLVSSDINSANHNYPTNYNEAIYVAGALPDSAPSDCDVPEAPGTGDLIPLPNFGAAQCGQFFDFLSDRTGQTTPPTTQPPTTSFFRNSNLTQYGGKADVVLMGSTGSENTGQASGAAGLLASYGRDELGSPLSGNEIRQLMTMTAEDVMPENTGVIGQPDKANNGWDPHFGYGRVNLAGAMDRIKDDRIPPEAQLDAPDWFAPVNVDRVGADGIPIEGRVGGGHTPVGDWELEYKCGQDALDSDFGDNPPIATGSGTTSGELGTLSQAQLQGLADSCQGDVQNDFGRPSGRSTDPPGDPYPDPDPERHAFQIRLTVHEEQDEGTGEDETANIGRYRKTLFAYNDDGNLAGWPKPIGSGSQPGKLVTGSGGETPPRLADLNADNELDVVQGTSSGELHVLDANGDPLPSFNGGQPVQTDPYAQASSHDRPANSLSGAPREPLRAPAIGDLDGNGEPEIVATAGEHVYAWHRDGEPVDGFPARLDPALSEPCVDGVEKPCFDAADRAITSEHHIKRGFLGAPALADLDGDGGLDIVTGALDQHVYAFDGDGDRLQGFNNGEPVELDADGDPATGAEIPTSPTIADLDGNGDPEVVIATNEVLEPEFGEDSFPDAPGGFVDAIARSGLGQSVVYAVDGDGSMFPGEWPVKLGTLAGDILPLVVPGNDAAAVNADADAGDEVAVSAATADAKLVDGDGSTIKFFSNDGAASPNVTDQSLQLNLADYPSVGELTDGTGPSVIKGGISLNGVANLLAVNQNLPFNHVVQAWRAEGATDPQPYDPSYPLATDDFQLVSQPAIAKVDGSPLGRQALFGTGLYQLHAYGPAGTEPTGWPKFLGGWVQPTPASGDVNGDGDLEVTAVTREGWSFVWETGADACQEGSTTTNQEWWTFHHDEFGTANYGTDARPPSRPGRIDVAPGAAEDLELFFTASGDDLACGTPDRYEARGFDDPPGPSPDFEQGEELTVEGDPEPGGQQQELTLRDAANSDFVLIRAVDDAGNVSYIRSAATPERPDCKGEEATMVGTSGADDLRGTDERDVILARDGDDEIRGRGGDDLICGKGGREDVRGNSGDDQVYGGSDDDEVDGGSGEDQLDGNGGEDDLEGGDDDDFLDGGNDDDKLNGNSGDDRLVGDDGDDDIEGGKGDDELRGNEGDDRLRGGSGDDDVDGGSGNNDVRD